MFITSHSFLSISISNPSSMHFLFVFFFFFFFFSCGQNNVWHLNHSFSFNYDSASYEDQDFVWSPLDLNISYYNQEVYACLCFTSPTRTRPLSYTLSICLTTQPYVDDAAIVVWSANRGNPVRGEKMSLTLDEKGNLVLRGDPDDTLYWSSNTAGKGVIRMELSPQYPVNLVLFDSNSNTIWQSVDFPTDTLTFNQSLKQGMKLVSRASYYDPSEGIYSLVVEHSGVVLYSNSPTPQPYRVEGSCGHTLESVKNSSCKNVTEVTFSGTDGLVADQNNNMHFAVGSYVNPSTSLLRLEWDGNVHAYTMDSTWLKAYDSTRTKAYNSRWIKAYEMFTESTSCSLPMRCGPYGVCRSQGQCTCPEDGNSTFFAVLNVRTQSCGLAQSLQNYCPVPGNNTTTTQSSGNLQMLEFEGLDHLSNAYTSPLHSIRTKERCKDECHQNCSCLAAFWHNHSLACFHVDQMGALVDSHVDQMGAPLDSHDDQYGEIGGALNASYYAFLKVEGGQSNHEGGSRSKRDHKYVIGVVFGITSLLLLFFLLYFIYRRVRGEEEEEEAIMDAIPGLPTRYSYKELHFATNGFADKLGHGGFGSVYAGTLLSNGITTKVAVKQLEGVRQGDKEFRSEVAIMGTIHHFNLLRLLGFCAQGSHRLLVYEYMENGSLDQCLFIKHQDTMKTPLPWDVRCRIGLGAARGLAYLHEECQHRILHLDIKPQNILLDENYVAKVADFGLSRLMERDESHVMTTLRGTPGYLAPEWLKEGSIDEKCDVFSFGKLLLEIISGRKNLDQTMESREQIYYPEWAFWQAQKGNAVGDLTNAKIESEEEKIEVRRMINIAFLCVLEKPTLRPSMEKVVHMLEGRVPVTHIDLSTLHQDLLFVLRNPSNVSHAHIEEEAVNILTFSPSMNTASCSAEVSSFYISTR